MTRRSFYRLRIDFTDFHRADLKFQEKIIRRWKKLCDETVINNYNRKLSLNELQIEYLFAAIVNWYFNSIFFLNI